MDTGIPNNKSWDFELSELLELLLETKNENSRIVFSSIVVRLTGGRLIQLFFLALRIDWHCLISHRVGRGTSVVLESSYFRLFLLFTSVINVFYS